MSSAPTSYKVVLLGDSAVGKSSLVSRYVRDEFSESPQPTIGAAFLTKTVKLGDRTIKFEIWDTAGQERYRSLAPMYYRGAAAALVVFDLTDTKSFEGAKSWVQELRKQGAQDIVLALVGNKKDLPRKVDAQLVHELTQEIYVETSAKTGENIARVFEWVGERLPRRREVEEEDLVVFGGVAQSTSTSSNTKCC